jgi:zinc protease
VTDKALTEFMKELNGVLQAFPDDELTRGKNYVALGYPDGFESVAQIAGMIGEMITYNLPENYFNTYVGNVLAVTKEDVQRVAKAYIDPARMVIVVVGDRKTIEKGIKSLNLGSVQTMTIEEVLGKPPKL